MSVQDYMAALKIGKKEYHACTNKGKYPYLPVLENIMDDDDIDSEVSLGEDQIPLRLVVGTCTAGRTNAFADNFMPIMDWGTEFAAKWASLSDSQVNEGIREPIKVYEYMNKFYVLEGNKRVSVLKYFNAVTVNAKVIRKVPKKSDKPEIKIYYEFMEFYKSTKLNDIYFSNEGSFTSLMELVGITPGEPMDADAKMDFVSSYLRFRSAYESRGGDRFDYPAGDAYLRFIHIHGYDNVKNMSVEDMNRNVAKTWAEFILLDKDSEVEVMMNPGNTEMPKKNVLSYLLPQFGGTKKLKIGFIYEGNPQSSQWSYGHDLGRRYIEDTLGDMIETVVVQDVIPEVNDEETIKRLVEEDKVSLIFVTSSAFTMAALKQAIAYPNVNILCCSLNTAHRYIRTYYARMYEAKFVTGVIAGIMTENDKVGYVAGYPLYGTMANINSFALGIKMVNPNAKLYLDWNTKKGYEHGKLFAENDINCMSDQDMITPDNKVRHFGLYTTKNNISQQLAMPMWHWGVFYEKLIQSIISGSWNKDDDNTDKALNYWWGMSAGVVDTLHSNSLPVQTSKLVELLKKDISSGGFNPFSGEIVDQEGNVRCKKGQTLSPDEIIKMDWLVDNVVGEIPDIDELDEKARLFMSIQGLVEVDD